MVQGQVRAPKEGERYFALLRANTINFDTPEVARHRVHFDNLTPYYPTQKLNLEVIGPEGHVAPGSSRSWPRWAKASGR